MIGAAASVGAVYVAWEIGNAIYDFATGDSVPSRAVKQGAPNAAIIGWEYLTGTGRFDPKNKT